MSRSSERWETAVACETLASPRLLESFQAESGTFRGLAASFHDLVQSFEPSRIDPGAFVDSLAEDGPGAVKLLWQHRNDDPVGKLLTATESSRGLEITGQVSRVQRFSDIVALARDQVLALSIGFDPQDVYYANDGPDGMRVRHIRKLKLWEVSFCTFPASKSARIEEVYRYSRSPDARTQHNLAQLRAAELQYADVLAARDRQYVAMASKTVAQRCDELAMAMMTYKSPRMERDERPSPEREYARYLQQVRAQGRQVFADGSFVPLTIEEAGYAGRLFSQIQHRRRAAANRREQDLYQAGAAYHAAASRPTSYWHVRAWG